jgi:hypothetical protein
MFAYVLECGCLEVQTCSVRFCLNSEQDVTVPIRPTPVIRVDRIECLLFQRDWLTSPNLDLKVPDKTYTTYLPFAED